MFPRHPQSHLPGSNHIFDEHELQIPALGGQPFECLEYRASQVYRAPSQSRIASTSLCPEQTEPHRSSRPHVQVKDRYINHQRKVSLSVRSRRRSARLSDTTHKATPALSWPSSHLLCIDYPLSLERRVSPNPDSIDLLPPQPLAPFIYTSAPPKHSSKLKLTVART